MLSVVLVAVCWVGSIVLLLGMLPMIPGRFTAMLTFYATLVVCSGLMLVVHLELGMLMTVFTMAIAFGITSREY